MDINLCGLIGESKTCKTLFTKCFVQNILTNTENDVVGVYNKEAIHKEIYVNNLPYNEGGLLRSLSMWICNDFSIPTLLWDLVRFELFYDNSTSSLKYKDINGEKTIAKSQENNLNFILSILVVHLQ